MRASWDECSSEWFFDDDIDSVSDKVDVNIFLSGVRVLFGTFCDNRNFLYLELDGEDNGVMKLKNKWDELVSDCEKKLMDEGDEDGSIDFKVLMNSFLAGRKNKPVTHKQHERMSRK